jgi:hypothetical protein
MFPKDRFEFLIGKVGVTVPQALSGSGVILRRISR